jgi:hypothetical protein
VPSDELNNEADEDIVRILLLADLIIAEVNADVAEGSRSRRCFQLLGQEERQDCFAAAWMSRQPEQSIFCFFEP